MKKESAMSPVIPLFAPPLSFSLFAHPFEVQKAGRRFSKMAAAFPRLNRSGGRLIVIPASGAESAAGLYACFISGLKAGGRYVPSAAGDAAGEHPRGHPPGRPGDRGRDHGFRPCLPVFFRPFAAAEAKARQKKLCRLAGVLHGAVLLGPCPDVFDP